jgi:hypothetical protein
MLFDLSIVFFKALMLAPQVASFLIKKKEVAQAAMSRTSAIPNIQ